LYREEEQANRTIPRQKIRVQQLFPCGSQIADNLEPELSQHLLVISGQAGEMIGTENQPLPHMAGILGSVAAKVPKINSPGEGQSSRAEMAGVEF
jgi:hypothetical protein